MDINFQLVWNPPKTNGVISIYGIAEQITFSWLGKRIPKQRLTHDESLFVSSGKSVKKRATQGDLHPLIYGHCLLRTIHYIHAAVYREPWQYRRLMYKPNIS